MRCGYGCIDEMQRWYISTKFLQDGHFGDRDLQQYRVRRHLAGKKPALKWQEAYMNENKYDRPQLVLLDAGSNYGYGSCTGGGNFKCNAGGTFGSGATCKATGQWANAACSSGTSVGGNICKAAGAGASTKCRTGTSALGNCSTGNSVI